MNALRSTSFDWALLGERLQGHWQASPLARLLPWWRDELCACLPVRLRQRLTRRQPVVGVRWPLAAGATPAGDTAVTLLLAPSLVLECELQLPCLSRPALRKVLSFELDRYTPFTPEQVHFDAQVRAGATPGQNRVRLVLIERARLAQQLSEAHALGLQVAAVDVTDEHGAGRGLELLPQTAEARARQRVGWLRTGLMGASGVLLLACLDAWVVHRTQALEARATQLAQLRQQAQQVDAMRKQLQARNSLERALRQRESQRLGSVALLDLLSRCVPEDTWLEELRLNADGSLLFSGSSRQASGLPAQLGQCAGLEKVTFQGGIQPDRTSRLERFTLHAQRPEHEE